MKRYILFLFTIFITSSFLTIHATGISFKNVQVHPLYRLPDKDITIEWSTPSPNGVVITYGDHQIVKDSEGKLILTPKELSSLPEKFEVQVKVNEKDGEEKKYNVQTFNEPRKIEIRAFQDGVTDKFLIKFNDKEWDNDLVIKKIELDSPKSYYVPYSPASLEAREIQTKWQYYNKSRDVNGYLRSSDQYESTMGLPAKPNGIWTFKLWNYPWAQTEDIIRPNFLDPIISFTISAKEYE